MASAKALEGGINLNSKRHTLKLRGLPLFLLSFQALGIIYSDIGTSPLYTVNGIWPITGPPPSKEDVIGGISAIIWAISLLPLLKYVIISLYFGTGEGEGGTFALFQGLFPPAEKDYDADRTLTGDSSTGDNISDHSGFRRISQKAKWPLLIWCLLGTSLTMADGVFTPAVSVTSAVVGIGIAKPNVANSRDITGISIAILLALFAVQRFGTARIAWTFGPISFIWFLILAGTGIYNITFFPGIFRAFDPSRAVLLFVRTGNYDILAGVVLALTGCEAVFANLGQFNAASIRISFTTVVYPSLMLAYLGQGARLIDDGETVIKNAFYNSIPGPVNGPLYWFVFVFAILATVVASQAMITATFSLFQQLINTKSFPPIRMIYTSDLIQGQIYIPAVNWTVMIAAVVVVAAFTNLANLTNAYGFAVATVMISTSVLLAVHMFYIKHLHLVIAAAYFLIFCFFDGLFWGASLKKVPHGAWVPLVMGVVLSLIMILWTWAKSLEDDFDGANRMNLRHFIQQGSLEQGKILAQEDSSSISDSDHKYFYTPTPSGKIASGEVIATEKKELQRISSCAVFHKIAEGKGVPHTFIGFIRQWPALPRVVIFLSVRIVPIARVHKDDRYVVTKVRTVEGFYGVTYHIGFRDDFNVKIDDLIDQICVLERSANPQGAAAINKEIRAVSGTSTHITPHYHVVSRKVDVGAVSVVVNWFRKLFIEDLYRRLATMFPETGNWLNPADEIIHVGINAVI